MEYYYLITITGKILNYKYVIISGNARGQDFVISCIWNQFQGSWGDIYTVERREERLPDLDHDPDLEDVLNERKNRVLERENQGPKSDVNEVKAEKKKDVIVDQEDIKIIS